MTVIFPLGDLSLVSILLLVAGIVLLPYALWITFRPKRKDDDG